MSKLLITIPSRRAQSPSAVETKRNIEFFDDTHCANPRDSSRCVVTTRLELSYRVVASIATVSVVYYALYGYNALYNALV